MLSHCDPFAFAVNVLEFASGVTAHKLSRLTGSWLKWGVHSGCRRLNDCTRRRTCCPVCSWFHGFCSYPGLWHQWVPFHIVLM